MTSAKNTNHLTNSTGILANDQAVSRHLARLGCIEAAIHQLGRLRNEFGMSIDAMPMELNNARTALWAAYHAELKRRPALMPLEY